MKNHPEVILVYTKDSMNHVHKSQQLAAGLADICQVTDIWQVETSGDQDLLENLRESLNRADIIVIVYSHYIRQKIQQLLMVMEQPMRRSVEDLVLYLMITSKKKPDSRVLTVYFPETTTCNMIEGIEWPQPMALPASLHALRQQIQNPGPCGISSADPDTDGLDWLANNRSIDSISLECSPSSCSPITEFVDENSQKSNCFVPIFRPSITATPRVLTVPSMKLTPSPLYVGQHHWVAPAFQRDAAKALTSLPCPSYAGINGVSSSINNRWSSGLFRPPPPFRPPRRWNSIETDIQSEYLASINDEHNCTQLDRNMPCQQLPVVATTTVSAVCQEEGMSHAVHQQLSLVPGTVLSTTAGQAAITHSDSHSRWSF